MASRLSIPSFPQIDTPDITNAPRRASDALAKAWPDSRDHWKLAIWQLLFLPYWLGSDIQAPRLPEWNAPLPAGGLAGEHVKKQIRSVARRTWVQRALSLLARALWLTIFVAAVWQAIDILGGPETKYSVLPWVGIFWLIPALVLAALSRPSNVQVARMLDRSFHLQERTVTALSNIGCELPAEGERAGIRYLQVADTANALTMIRGDAAFRLMPPVRELVLAIICGLAFASLLFLRGGDGQVPPLQPAVVPEFIPAAQRFVSAPDPSLPGSPLNQSALSTEEMQALAEQTGNARQDLQTLAGAMEDHAFTRSAANAINQGNFEGAVQTLNSVAELAGDLSENERESLASDLESAATEMSESGQNLAEAANEAADGLREGGASAQEGVEGIADAIQETAQQISQGESLDEAMQSQQSQSSTDPGQGGESQSGGEQSLFDQDAPGSASQSGSQNEESQAGTSGETAQSESGSDSEGSAESAEQQGAQSGEGQPGSGQPGSEAMPPSGDVTGGGQTPYDDPAMMESAPVTGESQNSTSGDGAGTESSDETGPPGASSGEVSGEDLPAPSEADVTTEGSGGGSGDDGGDVSPGGTVTLNRMPNGEAVPVQGAGSQSNLGSGAGMTTGGGGSAQGEVGDSGPDSNHVPSEYRQIVESYFSSDDE